MRPLLSSLLILALIIILHNDKGEGKVNSNNKNKGQGGGGVTSSTPSSLLPDIFHQISSEHTESCPNNESWCANLDESEALALQAIRTLHGQLDDDQNGNIDLQETDEFLREELKYEKNIENRQRAFHQNDDTQVSVREFWETWRKSEVHNWTTEQTVEWLIYFVGLPQHQDKFQAIKMNGTLLPILAVNHSFLQVQLGIRDSITRQRIAVKAMDVVLFGPPRDTRNTVKDIILTTLLAAAVIACYMVYKRYLWAQEDLTKMSKHMAELAKAEHTLFELQRELEKAKTDQDKEQSVVSAQKDKVKGDLSSDDPDEMAKLKEENMVLRSELHRAEVELQDKCWVPPPALQHWLQYTYELELRTYNKKKQSAEKQLKQAKDACDKLKKKRSSLMGAFVTTHGRSIDDVDKAILEARTALTEITHELQERMYRWKQIEILIGCSVMNNPGLQYLESLLKVYGKPQSAYSAGPGSVISNSQDDIDDDGASSIYSPSAVHKLISSSTFLMFPGPQNISPYATTPPTPPTTTSASSSARVVNFHIVDQSSRNEHSTSSSAAIRSCPNSGDFITISENSVSSGPTSHVGVGGGSHALQLAMARSKSASSMLSLRERGISRDNSSKESSNGEDDLGVMGGMGGLEAGDLASARRVTFRADHRSRMKAYHISGGRSTNHGLFESMDNEEARRVVTKALSHTHGSLDSIASSSKIPEEKSSQGQEPAEGKEEVNGINNKHHHNGNGTTTPPPTPSAQNSVKGNNKTTIETTKKKMENGNGVPKSKSLEEEGSPQGPLIYPTTTKTNKRKTKFWSAISKFTSSSSSNTNGNSGGGPPTGTGTTTTNNGGGVGGNGEISFKKSRSFSGMIGGSSRRQSDKKKPSSSSGRLVQHVEA